MTALGERYRTVKNHGNALVFVVYGISAKGKIISLRNVNSYYWTFRISSVELDRGFVRVTE